MVKMSARRAAECVNPGSEKLRLVLVSTRCNSSGQNVVPSFLLSEIGKSLSRENDLASEMATQSGSSGDDNLSTNGEIDVERRAIIRRCAQLAREIANFGVFRCGRSS